MGLERNDATIRESDEVIVALTPRSCQARFHRRGDVDCALMAFADSTIANCSREMPMDGEFLATQADDVPVAREEQQLVAQDCMVL